TFPLRHTRPPSPTPFPYTTLFRSVRGDRPAAPVRPVRLVPRGPVRLPALRPDVADCAVPPTGTAGRDADGRRAPVAVSASARRRSEEHTSELQSPYDLVCRLLLEK